MLERMMRNVLNKHGINKNVITLVTLVEIDQNDTAFNNPSKRIGKIYIKEEADKLAKEKGWIFKPTGKVNGGFQRVVPSPTTLDIIQGNDKNACTGRKYSNCSRRWRHSDVLR